MQINTLKVCATTKCPITKFTSRTSHNNRLQCCTRRKRIRSNAFQAGSQFYIRQIWAQIKRIIPNGCYTIFNHNVFNCVSATMPWCRAPTVVRHISGSGNRQSSLRIQRPGQIVSAGAAGSNFRFPADTATVRILMIFRLRHSAAAFTGSCMRAISIIRILVHMCNRWDVFRFCFCAIRTCVGHYTGGAACRSSCFCPRVPGMTQGIHIGIHISVTTHGTHMCRISLLCAGRRSYCIFIAMPIRAGGNRFKLKSVTIGISLRGGACVSMNCNIVVCKTVKRLRMNTSYR